MHCRRSLGFAILALIVATASARAEELPSTEAPTPPSSVVVGGTSLAIAAGALSLGAISWWGGRGIEPFRLKDSGFFGRETRMGGSDKAGHFLSSYIAVSVMSQIYQGLGVTPERARWYALAFTFLVANGVEVIDGFTPHHFEYGDVVMNTLGQAVGLAGELVPSLRQVLGFRIGYVPSPRFIENPKKNYIKLINDYSGQTFYADLKLGGALTQLGLPAGPLRFFSVGPSYSTNKYAPRKNPGEKRRNLGAHVSVALPAVLDALDLGPAGHVASEVFEYVAVPFTTVQLVRELNGNTWLVNFGVANRLEVPL